MDQSPCLDSHRCSRCRRKSHQLDGRVRKPEYHAAPRLHERISHARNRARGAGLSGEERHVSRERQQRDVQRRQETIRRRIESRHSRRLEMSLRYFSIAVFIVVIALAPLSAAAQTKSNWTSPKTPWGDPDIQGQWPAASNIPMQRPTSFGERATLTDAELAQRERQVESQLESDTQEFAKGSQNVTINPPSYWQERGKPNRQASLVVDPPNGRIPPMTPEGQKYVQNLRGGLGPGQHFPDKVDSWEDFDIYSRCITRGLVSSILPTIYNFGNQIVQAPGYVVIRNEMIHEARVIPLDSRPHTSPKIPTYMGDSRGHWEGSSLVVETTNFND